MTLFNVQRQADQAGYHLAFLVAALTMVSGSVIASRVRDADATMAPAPAAADVG